MSKEYGHNESQSRTPEYVAWIAMKQRCRDKNYSQWEYYGGRGIKVCSKWIHSYLTFLKDMGRKPSKLHTLDRVNSNGNYEPENCQWLDRKGQANNRRARRWHKKP